MNVGVPAACLLIGVDRSAQNGGALVLICLCAWCSAQNTTALVGQLGIAWLPRWSGVALLLERR